MRRPLADAGLFFIFIIIIIQLLVPIQLPDYSDLDGKTYTIEGTLVRHEYRKKDNSLQSILYIKNASLNTPQIQLAPKYMIMCYMNDSYSLSETGVHSTNDYPPLGTHIRVRGSISTFSTATNPGNFDSAKYYSILNIAFSMRSTYICADSQYTQNDSSSVYWQFREKLSRFREKTSLLCDLAFSEEDSAILKTMLLGDKSSLTSETKSLYSQNGIAHILAISGLHISILGMALYKLMRRLKVPVWVAAPVSVMTMIMYIIMTGMAASSVRALIMFSLRMLAPVIHRTYDMLTSIVIAAVLILLEQPAYVFYSGFQFSFGAVCGVILIVPLLKDYLPSIINASLSITLITLPIHLYNYFYFPILSIILNLYVIPLMSLLLVLAILSIVSCVIFIPLSRIIALPAHLILQLYQVSCNTCDKLPISKMVTGRPRLVQIIIYFILLFIILFFRKKQTKLQLLMNLLGACIILSFHIPALHNRITMVDVGQGDCIHVTNGFGLDFLIDGGSSTINKVGQYRIEPYLLSQGIASLDAVFITHLDTDHYNGILELMEASGHTGPCIEKLFISSSTVKAGGSSYESLLYLAKQSKIPVYVLTQGDVYSEGNINIYCLYPDKYCAGENTNDESMVLMIDYGKEKLLLTGDLAGNGETTVTDKYLQGLISPEDITILKIAHHGSKNSTYEEFLDTLSPDLALISAGKDNSYGHPNPILIERLKKRNIPHYCTMDYGALTIDINRRGINVRSYSSTRSRFLLN